MLRLTSRFMRGPSHESHSREWDISQWMDCAARCSPERHSRGRRGSGPPPAGPGCTGTPACLYWKRRAACFQTTDADFLQHITDTVQALSERKHIPTFNIAWCKIKMVSAKSNGFCLKTMLSLPVRQNSIQLFFILENAIATSTL